jgi:uncharacterized membrane protein YtjA (UPF0391 family)
MRYRERINIDASGQPAVVITTSSGGRNMLRWALTFLIFALIAGVLGFTGIAGESMYIARILFVVFLIVFVISLLFGLATGRRPAGI